MSAVLQAGHPADPLDQHIRPGIAAMPDNRIADIARYGWAAARDDLIPLWFGEGDIPTPRFICDAAHQAMLAGHVFYGDQRGQPELRAALDRYLGRVYGNAVGDDRIYVMTSGMAGIMIAIQTLVDPGDEVVVISPVWPNIASAVGVLGGKVVEVAMSLGNDGWTLDLAHVAQACGPRTRAIFVNTPGNPTGWVMPRAQIEGLMALARARGIWVIADEVYSRLTYDAPRAPSFLDVVTPDDLCLIVNSFSKNWSMTGWRLGWVIAPRGMSAIVQRMVQFNNSGTAGFVQMAGVAALEEGEPFVEEVRALCARGRDIVMDTLASKPRVHCQRPQGAFYAFFSVDGVDDTMAFARRIIDEVGVGLAPGSAFGLGGGDYLRLCFASSEARLVEAMRRLGPLLD